MTRERSLLVRAKMAVFVGLGRRRTRSGKATFQQPTVAFLCFDLSVLDIYDSMISACVRRNVQSVIVGFMRVDVRSDKNRTGFLLAAQARYPMAKVLWAKRASRKLDRILRQSHSVFFTGGSGAYPDFLKIETLAAHGNTAYIQYGFLLSQHEEYQFAASHVLSAQHIFSHTYAESQRYLAHADTESLKPHVHLTGYPRWESMFRDERRSIEQRSAKERVVALAFHWTIGEREHNKFGNLEDRIDEVIRAVDAFRWVRFIWVPHPNLISEISRLPEPRRLILESQLRTLLSKRNVENCSGVAPSEVERTSVAIISDCISFLADFFPGGKPYLFVARCKDERASLTALGEKLISSYQARWPQQEIVEFLRDVLDSTNTPPLGETELELLEELEFFRSAGAGDRVLESLGLQTS